ncbi:hypothetical protein GT625_29300 [Burkholderia thailandensis]|nr:hypothetical protein A8H31_17665 [Burkholderia thailandensis]AWY57996.1 hypothetical protein A8H35_05605 [Burkholderia thailandensis]NBJ22728.1 hypothetical protein [Burkholderia thailandensis]NOK56883.1 hypothetical protein [Burkholderia thailandensis]
MTANEKKDLAHARVSASDGADAWVRFTVAGKRFDMPVVINASLESEEHEDHRRVQSSSA